MAIQPPASSLRDRKAFLVTTFRSSQFCGISCTCSSLPEPALVRLRRTPRVDRRRTMPTEKQPKASLPVTYVPPEGERFKVGGLRPEEGWDALAKMRGIDARALIEFNFKTH